ncbi:hypothetical protein [Acinetobacter courvalinii]|uniref:hypothetical protein n=1 Tax=Acinetobacter courvalinii TaxID=280147 RepID=UPI00289A1C03|nr:hypothetical protein [Acinetobacter courvalinii]
MNYQTGEMIELGDSIELSGDMTGVVVGIIDDSKFTESYPKEEWDYLEKGILIFLDQAGLIHYPDITEDMKLINKPK